MGTTKRLLESGRCSDGPRDREQQPEGKDGGVPVFTARFSSIVGVAAAGAAAAQFYLPICILTYVVTSDDVTTPKYHLFNTGALHFSTEKYISRGLTSLGS